MIIKPKNNNSFPATCRYVLQETDLSKQAEVLATYGVRSDSAAHMAADFDAVRAMRPGLGKAVMHVIIAFPAEEKGKVTDAMMTSIVRDYLKEMEISAVNTQWAAVRHTDKDHPHLHLLVNRVDLNGQTVSDTFCRFRSVDAAKKLEQVYGLVVADQVGQKQACEIGPTPAQAKATTPKEMQSADWSRARQRIGSALLPCKGVQGSFAELNEALQPQGIGMELTQRKDGSRLGVVFVLDGQRVKGKQLGTEFTAEKLQEGFDQVQAARREEQQKAADQKAAELKAAPDHDQKRYDQLAVPAVSARPSTGGTGSPIGPLEASEPTADRAPLGRVVQADSSVATPSGEAVPQQSRPAPDKLEVIRQEELLRQAAEQATAGALAGIRQEWVNIATMVQQAAQAERAGDYGRVAELRYGAIQEAEQRITAHEEQAKATPAGHGLLDEMYAQEQDRRRVAAQVEAAEQQRQRTAEDIIQKAEDARQKAEAPQIERQRRANAAIAAFQQAHQQVAEYRTQTDEARDRYDYVSVGILRGIITRAEGHVQHCEVELRRTLGPADSLVHIEAQKKLQQEQAQAKYEREQLANLESFRQRAPFSGTHIRLQVPAEYLPTVTAAIGRRNQTEYDWQEHADKTISPRVIDGKVAINVRYETKENDAKLDDALREFRKNGVEVFEQPADRTKREERAANARAFERQYAEKMSQSKALPEKQIAPPQIEM